MEPITNPSIAYYETVDLYQSSYISMRTGHLPTLATSNKKNTFLFRYPAVPEVITAATDFITVGNEFRKFSLICRSQKSELLRVKHMDKGKGASENE